MLNIPGTRLALELIDDGLREWAERSSWKIAYGSLRQSVDHFQAIGRRGIRADAQ
jgi:hypothetical protein